jgi:hypothetical protein
MIVPVTYVAAGESSHDTASATSVAAPTSRARPTVKLLSAPFEAA